MEERARPSWPAIGLLSVILAAALTAVFSLEAVDDWSDLSTWDTYVGLLQKLVTILGIVGAAYWAWRPFVAGAALGTYGWSLGAQLAGRPFVSPEGERDHEDIEPGSSIRSTVAIPVPAEGGPYELFLVRFTVEAASAAGGEPYVWLTDAIAHRDSKVTAREEDAHGDQQGQAAPRGT